MVGAITAGGLYFAVVFAVAFCLGVIRSLWIEPRLGAVSAVLAEAPVLLVLSWVACRRLVAHLQVPARIAQRAAMGAVALAVLLVAEAGVSVLLAGRTLEQHLALYREAAPRLGLAAQVLFALFPLIQMIGGSAANGRRAP